MIERFNTLEDGLKQYLLENDVNQDTLVNVDMTQDFTADCLPYSNTDNNNNQSEYSNSGELNNW
ncbi:MAG: hypothetical protein PHX60_14720 [Giesbergeria sp.]|uniref:hypothetical protein n=1 Tax=Giesbergeria sp. TaxID=2818473 RepID=UPI002631ECD0|nr:hypothetical protein [Giesbergeria sp.]MDD2610908.1 hypothetical protein [Giesbergeria sp.]